MSVILVHTGVSHTRIEYSIWEALNQTWPHSSTVARFGTGFSPNKELDVSQADLIISTSLDAAASIKCQDHQLHMCYLEPLSNHQRPLDHELINSLTEIEFVVPTRTLQNQNRDRFTSFVRPPVETDFFNSGYGRGWSLVCGRSAGRRCVRCPETELIHCGHSGRPGSRSGPQ